jgi:hypothetical protein
MDKDVNGGRSGNHHIKQNVERGIGIRLQKQNKRRRCMDKDVIGGRSGNHHIKQHVERGIGIRKHDTQRRHSVNQPVATT